METSQVLWIPGVLPGLNEIIRLNRANKYAAAESKRNLTQSIGLLAKTQLKPCEAIFLEFTWVEKNKRRDPDNVAAGKKFILDAFVEAGILKNDGWREVLGWKDVFEVDKNNPGVRVLIFE
jgi:hypothetical protein